MAKYGVHIARTRNMLLPYFPHSGWKQTHKPKIHWCFGFQACNEDNKQKWKVIRSRLIGITYDHFQIAMWLKTCVRIQTKSIHSTIKLYVIYVTQVHGSWYQKYLIPNTSNPEDVLITHSPTLSFKEIIGWNSLLQYGRFRSLAPSSVFIRKLSL